MLAKGWAQCGWQQTRAGREDASAEFRMGFLRCTYTNAPGRDAGQVHANEMLSLAYNDSHSAAGLSTSAESPQANGAGGYTCRLPHPICQIGLTGANGNWA